MALSKEEIVLLKQVRELSDMLATPGWKVYREIIEAQMQTRLDLLLRPAHDLPTDVTGVMDGQTRYGAVEHIKGAYNGLRLALSIPHTMVDEAKLLRDSSPTEGESK